MHPEIAGFGIISPQDWHLNPAQPEALRSWERIGLHAATWEERARMATYHWLLSNWREEVGAFAGHYKTGPQVYEDPQLTNLIAPWQCMAAADRYGDLSLLEKAHRAADWLYAGSVETHPMSLVIGGVHDSWQPHELWAKFVAELLMLNLGLYARTEDPELLRRAEEGAGFLLQAERHGHACKYDGRSGRWIERGWQSFGRVAEAFFTLYAATTDELWLEHARHWAEYGLTLQADNGCFYLIDDDYYNTDLAADELRALTFAYEATSRNQFLEGATRFADWHLEAQWPDGSWVLTIDRDGYAVSPYVGPGDIPNIAISLLRLHNATDNIRYLAAALQAMGYALQQQVTPDSDVPEAKDPNALWGYWSWDPRYDYTMSGDQITHYARGIWFTLDYLASFKSLQTAGLINELLDEGFAPLTAS